MVYFVEHNTQGSDAIRTSNYNHGESCSEENKVLSTINWGNINKMYLTISLVLRITFKCDKGHRKFYKSAETQLFSAYQLFCMVKVEIREVSI